MAVKGKALVGRKSSARIISKRTKLLSGKTGKSKEKAKGKDKEHAYDKPFIPIPSINGQIDAEITEDELGFFAEDIERASSFLMNLDEKGIARSKKEQERLHRLIKPQQRILDSGDDLPSIDSHSEDGESWSSGIEDDDGDVPIPSDDDYVSSPSNHTTHQKRVRRASDDEEMPYESMPRKRRKSWAWDSDEEEKGISRLPIKLQNGKIQKSEQKVILPDRDGQEESSAGELSNDENKESSIREDVSTGARFGRPAVLDVISIKSRKTRVQAAKEQMATICQDIIADPENSIGLLRRLHTFCLPQISTPTHPEPMPNDILIRRLALLSQLAVFRDIVPGYRIRPLTDKEKAEKVSQIVQRTREFEQGLVSVYQAYLRVLESELKGVFTSFLLLRSQFLIPYNEAKSELASTALQCICRLLTDLTHFNFRVNLMTAIVSRLSRKTWDEDSELCLKTLSSVLRNDAIGQASLEIVRTLNRMIKERRFNVHPNVMFCLLDLRLKSELGGVRASLSKADKEKSENAMSKGKVAARRAKGKPTAQPHLSKKAKKKLKEVKEIEDEMREANAEVDREERASLQTETLKLLFALYFRILKSDRPTPLLPAALQGISRFAHLVNIDFFRDLLQVLRERVSLVPKSEQTKEETVAELKKGSLISDAQGMHQRLHCIVTAFELLSGQGPTHARDYHLNISTDNFLCAGESLNIDLTDFINHIYALIIPLSSTSGIEEPVAGTKFSRGPDLEIRGDTSANMLFRALNLVFFPRFSSAKTPAWRSAAFAKRLLTASLHFPGSTASRTIKFVQSLFAKDPKLEALLSVEDRVTNGVYRPDIDDPQLCNPFATNLWELQVLSERHGDQEVRRLASELLHYSRQQD
ncbi:nucleolar complex-associated protein 3 [Sanghuangporus baumii]|uniref:Nucleolar complex-associated protein 3 n=1 Tax=Sanghuangporus baumii TaxID=108892 RepID=A0A9Q5MXR9_SANBA|nr:nucleolar complex-associated protein 3 [Sanghuangporus baumii]